MAEFVLTPPPDDAPLTESTFQQRFVLRIMERAAPNEFHSDADLIMYAKEAASIYWQERTDESPEQCADDDMMEWDR